METKTIFFKDELNDDFAKKKREDLVIDENYNYIKTSFFSKLKKFVIYRLITTPFAFLYVRIFKRVKFVNLKVLKNVKSGYFLYSNHVLEILDAFIPNVATFPKKTSVIVKSANLSNPFTKNFIIDNGALPIPNNFTAMKNFLNAISKLYFENSAIVIFPEAHVWPYYNKIRPFKSVSFSYPVNLNAPVFSLTTTFKKGKRKKPKITVYVDGPFFSNGTLPKKEQELKLCNEVYLTMQNRSKNSTYEYIKYQKVEND